MCKLFLCGNLLANAILAFGLFFVAGVPNLRGDEIKLSYSPAPVDNPLKGLVPYARPTPGRFPHSLEFSYLPLSDLMTGFEEFNWQPLENILDDIASRGHQTVFRIWLEYPGRDDGIPTFLEEAGVAVTEWENTNTAPFPPKMVRTPDYSDARLRKALQAFIRAMGKKYDGDPRIGFITAGLLGTWGEWHTYPRSELMASKTVQTEVMNAFANSFQVTPVLLRYPAGEGAWSIAANHDRPFGYHDDSFAWATLDTELKEDSWFYMAALKDAGTSAVEKWKTKPIGGEIRPELWGKIFDGNNLPEHAQDFEECVKQTHVSWLMDTGMFREEPSATRKQNAVKQVQRMGYEFHVQSVEWKHIASDNEEVTLLVANRGVAPFYYDWRVELGVFENSKLARTIPTNWSLLGLLPDSEPRKWKQRLKASELNSETRIGVRVVNPLKGGIPLRFANDNSIQRPSGWLMLPRSKN